MQGNGPQYPGGDPEGAVTREMYHPTTQGHSLAGDFSLI